MAQQGVEAVGEVVVASEEGGRIHWYIAQLVQVHQQSRVVVGAFHGLDVGQTRGRQH